ncbi:MAG: hypothetical protein ACYTBJ_15015 [Planctomycetota bacterium]
MNTFWLKVAGGAVVVVVLIILVGVSSSSKPEPEPEPEPKKPEKTFYDVAKHDRQRFLTNPQAANSVEAQAVVDANKPLSLPKVPQRPSRTVVLYFSELSELESIEAERLLNVAQTGFSVGRLPATGYNLAVQTCRQIIQRWPDSWYAYRAQQMLASIPERFRTRYNITLRELDLSRFEKPRPATKPVIVDKSKLR